MQAFWGARPAASRPSRGHEGFGHHGHRRSCSPSRGAPRRRSPGTRTTLWRGQGRCRRQPGIATMDRGAGPAPLANCSPFGALVAVVQWHADGNCRPEQHHNRRIAGRRDDVAALDRLRARLEGHAAGRGRAYTELLRPRPRRRRRAQALLPAAGLPCPASRPMSTDAIDRVMRLDGLGKGSVRRRRRFPSTAPSSPAPANTALVRGRRCRTPGLGSRAAPA